MKKNFTRLSLLIVATAAITSCKTTDWTKVKYEVTPSPLEVRGDSVAVAVKVTIPPKIFVANTAVVVTPSIKWNGGEKQLKPITFQGEKVKEGNGNKVSTEKGGTFNYTDKVAYQPEMAKAELAGKATVQQKKKSKEVNLPAIAQGTITTPLLIVSDEYPSMEAGDLSKVPPTTYDADINFAINQSKVRPTETSQADVKGINTFLKKSRKEAKKEKAAKNQAAAQAAAGTAQINNTIDSLNVNYFVKNVEIVGGASFDGKQDWNGKLAQDRGNSSEKFVGGELKAANIQGAEAEGFFKKSFVAEDWDGFKTMVAASDITDKDKVLSVISSTSDLDQREAELRGMKKTWKELANKILPKQRKATIKVVAYKRAKSNDEINKILTASPDSLSAEELLHAASLTNDANAKLAIYNHIARIYPNEWRGQNNIGVINLQQNNLDAAQAAFDKANTMSPNNPVVQNNLGIVALKKGDKKAAENYFSSASSAGKEARYNLANLYVRQGKYAEAVTSYGEAKTFNAGLASVLAGNFDAGIATIDASPDKDSAIGYYVKAVAAARKGDAAGAVGNLKNAIGKDGSYKDKAKFDLEFAKIKDNDAFKAALQ